MTAFTHFYFLSTENHKCLGFNTNDLLLLVVHVLLLLLHTLASLYFEILKKYSTFVGLRLLFVFFFEYFLAYLVLLQYLQSGALVKRESQGFVCLFQFALLFVFVFNKMLPTFLAAKLLYHPQRTKCEIFLDFLSMEMKNITFNLCFSS